MVKSMLADEGITGFVENANAPFPGLTTVPCQVLVAAADVIHARQLVEEHEARRKQHANNAELETDAEEPDVL